MNKFISFLDKIEVKDIFLIESIKKAYYLIFEGINDVKFVLNGNDLINDILHAIWTKLEVKRGSYPYNFEMDDTGFQISRKLLYKGYDLNIQWKENSTKFMPGYNKITNLIIIPYDINTTKYDKSYESIIKIIGKTKRLLIHELKHWQDNIEFDISKNKFTKISQLEMDSLKKLENSTFSFLNDPTVKYINQQTEINAYIVEFIDRILNEAIIKETTYNFKDLLVMFKKQLDFSFNNLTEDTKKRIYKRLFVFNYSLHNFIYEHTIKYKKLDNTYIPLKDRMTIDLKKELIKTIKEYTGIVESIDYTHQDILNKKDIRIFVVNYELDDDYKKWFDNKYVTNEKCKVKYLSDYINKKNRKSYIHKDPLKGSFGRW